MGGRLCPLISPLGQPCLCLIKHASQPVHQFLSQPLRERPTEFLPAQMCLFQRPVQFLVQLVSFRFQTLIFRP